MDWDRKDAVRYALSRGVQISPDAFEILRSVPSSMIEDVTKSVVRSNKRERRVLITADELKECLGLGEGSEIGSDLRVISDPTKHITTGEGADGYGALFASRYEKLRKIISMRPEAKKIRTIASALAMSQRTQSSSSSSSDQQNDVVEDIHVAGLVDHREVKGGRAELRLEDPTGMLEAPVFNEDLQNEVGILMQDQFVMARVGRGKKGVYIKDVIQPDMAARVPNKSDTEAYAVFLSDLHVGSRYFMDDEFVEFVEWLSEYDVIAQKVRFVLLCGDVVDGVGIYKDQDKELVLKTAEEQLGRLLELLDGIPDHVRVVIAPGNHDPGRRALPQPAIPEKYCQGLWERPNITMVGNPAVVSLNGVRVLMFHGQSIDDIVRVTPGLSYDEPASVMEHLLRARHMSPIYGGRTPIAPEQEDWMVVGDDVDIFHVGHVHRWAVNKYRSTTLINSGTWQRQTPFQASNGLVPNPGIVTLVNLKTMEIRQKNYNQD